MGVTSMAWARGGAEWRSGRAARQADGGKVCEPAGREEDARFWQRGGGARAGATRSERTIGRRGGLRGGHSAVGLHGGGGGGTWTMPPLPRATASTAGLRQRRGHVGGGLRGSCGAVGLHGGGGGGVLGQHPPCCEPLQAQRSCSSVAGTPDRGGRSGGRLRGGTDCGGREATTPTWPEGSGGTRGEDATASTPTQSSEEELWRGWFGGRACAGDDGGGSLWSACPTRGVAAHKRTEERLGIATTPCRRTEERSGGGAAAEGRFD
eukprot:COSAG01_NODE_2048_length_8556_cov_27.174509_4_plen_265_part_00